MRLLILMFILFRSTEVWTQSGSDEYFEVDDIIIDEPLVVKDTSNWCIESTMPIWIGCDNDSIGDLNKCTETNILLFIQQNLIIPSGLGCFQGKVFISFVINKDGEVVDVELLKSVNETLDAAAIDAVKKLPLFLPATQRGKPTKVKYNVPVSFNVY